MAKGWVLIWAVALFGQEAIRNPRTSPADVAAGEKTFRFHCSPCHGLKGEGGRGPNLANGIFYRGSSDADLLANISNGIEGTDMPFLFYSPDRVWQVVAYIRSLNAAAQARPTGDVARGAALFRSSGCFQCHRVKGEGTRLGPDLTQIGALRSLEHLRQAIVDPNADVRQRYWAVTATDDSGVTREGFLMNEDTYTVQFLGLDDQLHTLDKSGLKTYKVERVSKMPSYNGKFTDLQLDDLVAYLSSLRPRGGAR